MRTWRADSIYCLDTSGNFFNREALVEFAAKARLPAIFPAALYAESGGLVSYSIMRRVPFQSAAAYVQKILEGVKPADLPVEQPTKFQLVINLQTAKALGMTMPASLLARADDVIE